MSARALGLAAACAAAATMPARAAAEAPARRVAIVVGNDLGGSSVGPLRYAERDAMRFAAVLRELGGVEEVEVLLGQRADDLRRSLGRLSAGSDRRVVFLFYYSGHADDTALLMNGTRMPFAELRRTIDGAPAGLAVAVIDACQSGRLLRAKGGKAVPLREVRFDGDATVRGRVYVTSTAAGEPAQESDELGASFFTHYLLSGLRGAADRSGDGAISLAEAYLYASQLTLARTSGTLRGGQHPNFDVDVSGAGDIVLTRRPTDRGYLILSPDAAGRYLVTDLPGGALLAEVVKRAGRSQWLALPAGSYEVSVVRGGRQGVQTVQVAATGHRVVDESAFTRRVLEVAVAKGPAERDPRFRASLGYVAAGGYLEQAGAVHEGRAALGRSFGRVWLGAYAAYGRSSYRRDDGIAVRLDEIGAGATAEATAVQRGRLDGIVGLDLGALRARQRARHAGDGLPIRSSVAGRYRVRVGLAWDAWPVGLGLFAELGQTLFEDSEGRRARPQLAVELAARASF